MVGVAGEDAVAGEGLTTLSSGGKALFCTVCLLCDTTRPGWPTWPASTRATTCAISWCATPPTRTPGWTASPSAGEGVISSFVRESALAGGRVRRVVDRIEPLVGHLRHPHGLPACVPPGQRGVCIEYRGYLLLSAPPAHRRGAFLFDAGTAAFNFNP